MEQTSTGVKPRPNRIPFALAALAVLLLAAALRLWGLGRESLWLDEATSLVLARMRIPDLLAWTAADIHPPLYYLMLHFWLRLGEGEALLRGLSVLGGVLGVGLTYLLARELFDEWVALGAALLLAVSPLHIWYSQELRGYVWLATFCTLALVGLARLVRSDLMPMQNAVAPGLVPAVPRNGAGFAAHDAHKGLGYAWRQADWPGWLCYVLGLALALYVHYYAVFAIMAANLLVLGLVLYTRRYRFLWPWIAAQVAVWVLYLPWLPTFLTPILNAHPGQGWVAEAGSPHLSALPATAVTFIVGEAQKYLPMWLRRGAYGLTVLALALGTVLGLRGADGEARRNRVAVIMALLFSGFCVAVAWAVSQVKPLYSTRYLLPFLPPFLILVARGVTMLGRRKAVWGVALAVLLAAPLWGTVLQERYLDSPDWRGLANELAARAQPGDVVLLMPTWNDKPLGYYLQGRVPWGEYIPEPVDPAHPEADYKAVDKSLVGRTRAWLLWQKGHYTDRTGVIAAYLDTRGKRLSTEPVRGVGELILYDLTQKP